MHVHHPNKVQIFRLTWGLSHSNPYKTLAPSQPHLLLLPILGTHPTLPSVIQSLSFVKTLYLQAVSERSLLFLALTVTWFSPEDVVSPAAYHLMDPFPLTALVSLECLIGVSKRHVQNNSDLFHKSPPLQTPLVY